MHLVNIALHGLGELVPAYPIEGAALSAKVVEQRHGGIPGIRWKLQAESHGT